MLLYHSHFILKKWTYSFVGHLYGNKKHRVWRRVNDSTKICIRFNSFFFEQQTIYIHSHKHKECFVRQIIQGYKPAPKKQNSVCSPRLRLMGDVVGCFVCDWDFFLDRVIMKLIE
jgi:hypothetical protein